MSKYTDLLGIGKEPDNSLRVGGVEIDSSYYYNNVLSKEDQDIVCLMVKQWLNEDNWQDVQFYIGDDSTFYFNKSTIAIKNCSNSWNIYNIATSSKWTSVISSDRIETITDNMSLLHNVPNEVRSNIYSENYGYDERLKNILDKRDYDLSSNHIINQFSEEKL